MAELSPQRFDELTAAQPDVAVSIYFPTHRAGRETREDPIRLKNAIREARQRLADVADTADEFLAPAEQLLSDENRDFWQHNDRGLALFASPSRFEWYRLPYPVDSIVNVDDKFLIKPLIRYFQDDQQFYVLAASQNEVRLFRGTKFDLDELQVESLPGSVREALNIDEYQSALQFHSHRRGGDSNRGNEAIYHGHGGGDDADKKQEAQQFFHRLDRALSEYLSGKSAPLVFAGVEWLFPLFQQTNSYPHLLPEPVRGNYDQAKPEALHAPAWELVRVAFEDRLAALREQFGTNQARSLASDDLSMIVRAADRGQIETLLVQQDCQVWGRVRADSSVQIDNEGEQAEREDLLDRAAAATLRHGGSVYVVEGGQLPTESPAACLLRFNVEAAEEPQVAAEGGR